MPRRYSEKGTLEGRLAQSLSLEIQVHASPAFFHHAGQESGEKSLFLHLP